jgi:hypothetical protein
MVWVPLGYSTDVATARTWNYFEALLPPLYLSVISILMALSIVIGIVMLFLLRPIARWLILGSIVLSILLIPFMGLSVLAPAERFVGALASGLAVLAVVLSFFSPMREHFERGARAAPEPPG